MYKRLDDNYIKPCLLRENHAIKDPKIIETYEYLKEREALEFMQQNPLKFAELTGSKSNLNDLAKENVANEAFKNIRKISAHHANIDPKELHYSQTQKDLDETRIHHMLSENLFMPRNRVSGPGNVCVCKLCVIFFLYSLGSFPIVGMTSTKEKRSKPAPPVMRPISKSICKFAE